MLTLTGPPENLLWARDMCFEMMVSSHPEASSSAHPPAQSAAPSARPVPSAAPSASARPVPSAAPSARFSAAPSAAHPARRAAQPLPPPAPGVAAAWQSGPVDVMMAWHAAMCVASRAFWSMSTPCGMHALAATGAQHPMGWAGGTAWPQQWDYYGAPCWGSAWADSAGADSAGADSAASGAAAAADVPTAQGSAATSVADTAPLAADDEAPQPKPGDDVEVLSDDASAQSDGSEYHGPCSWRRQAPAPKAASKAMPRSAPPAPKAIVPLRRRSPPRAASCAAPPSGSKRCASPCCAPQPPCSRGRCVERTWSKLRLPRRGRVYSTGAFGYDPADRNFEAKFYAKFVEWHPTINPAFGLCFRIPFNFIRCHVSGVFGVVFWEWQRFLF